ncbi:MAG: nucleotidyltransferase domain-containing protein [Thermodesulfobacteriota bacterium]|nr:nucleotidyltransferase domain-containing protein [Thermodesulfobacteriota bacterium]
MKRILKEKFKNLGVSIVYLFGSRAVNKGSRLSDVDIGAVFNFSPQGKDTRAVYQSLYEMFSEVYPGVGVDIVFLQAAPLALQYSAIKDGKILFEENPLFRADYENRVVNQHLDFKPLLDYFDGMAAKRYAQT